MKNNTTEPSRAQYPVLPPFLPVVVPGAAQATLGLPARPTRPRMLRVLDSARRVGNLSPSVSLFRTLQVTQQRMARAENLAFGFLAACGLLSVVLALRWAGSGEVTLEPGVPGLIGALRAVVGW